ncbi:MULTISPECIES: S26 family signal peptidase [unclassified Fusobacterium]|uniref:S26 family signal peptidase n=1 Tax=unclassified Fusobacterium TaxID=2648384 RepID=UPI001B8B523F|nr:MULTISPECIES: S26 family signal peptidase [unclassified Fusobacterium]MBR8700497.1 hypothetical protein [Fusobacterium sp. DD45]MBR8710238.1 hypothetical protein [Fusobacterium sp. DD28]MBR8750760.1 hypothetical protein [Fusobacterium sp. DD26]
MDAIQKNKFKSYRRNLIKFLAIVLIGFSLGLSFHYFGFIINVSQSLPPGIYRTYKIDRPITYDDIVVFEINPELAAFLESRNYQNTKIVTTIMKKVVGLSGDKFAYKKIGKLMLITKNGEVLGYVHQKDRQNRPLPHKIKGTVTLKDDEFFVMGDNIVSFDSRYFGTIRRDEIIKFAKPVFTFNIQE